MSEVKALEVQAIFDRFGVMAGGELSTFATIEEANEFAIIEGSKEATYQRAVAFAASLGLDPVKDKAAKGKVNVVVAFLNWEAKGSPEYVAPVDTTAKPEEAPGVEL